MSAFYQHDIPATIIQCIFCTLVAPSVQNSNIKTQSLWIQIFNYITHVKTVDSLGRCHRWCCIVVVIWYCWCCSIYIYMDMVMMTHNLCVCVCVCEGAVVIAVSTDWIRMRLESTINKPDWLYLWAKFCALMPLTMAILRLLIWQKALPYIVNSRYFMLRPHNEKCYSSTFVATITSTWILNSIT